MSDVYRLPEYRSFLAAIRAAPEDDLPRLVMADWLEERGEVERAEFIRYGVAHPHQRATCDGDRTVGMACPYGDDGRGRQFCPSCQQFAAWGIPERLLGEGGVTYHRGFLHTVSGPLLMLIGGECSHPMIWSDTSERCPACKGEGRTTGVLRTLLEREPVRSVEATDREPWESRTSLEDWMGWAWFGDDESFGSAVVPINVFAVMEGVVGHARGDETLPYKEFPTRDAANFALSAALLSLCSPEGVSV